MKYFSKFIKIGSINAAFALVGIIALELHYGKWLRIKPFVPNILPVQGISHDLRLLRNDWGITTRIPDENGTTLYSQNVEDVNSPTRCNLLVLGGSTAEERILRKEDTWTYRLFRDLNKRSRIRDMCPNGLNVTNAAVDGHSIVANYFDIIHWISRFKRRYGIAIVYQGINDFQGDILERPNWYDSYWQYVSYGLRYNSVFFRIFDSLRNSVFGQGVTGVGHNIRETVLVTPYVEDRSEWKTYSIDSTVHDRLSVGLDYHGRYVRLVAEELKDLGVRSIIWITQTKPFCKLKELPDRITVRGSKTMQDQINDLASLDHDELKSWIAHDRLGDCLRLGLIRSSSKVIF